MLAKLQNSPAPALLWQGNDGFILWDGKTLIATDLDLTLGERILPPTAVVDELAEKLDVLMRDRYKGKVSAQEIGLKVESTGMALPCGSTAFWKKEGHE